MKFSNKKILATLAVSVALAAAVLPGTSLAVGNPGAVDCVHWGDTPSTMSVNGHNTAVAHFTIPAKCTGQNQITLVSYKAPNNTTAAPYSQQTLYKFTSAVFGPGTHTLSVQVPDCYYQVDLVRGAPITVYNSDEPLYHNQERFLRAIVGGDMACTTTTPPATTEPPVTTTPPAATPAATTTVTTTAAPEALVNTGPGATVALFTVVSAAGAGLYNFVLRRKAAL